MSTAAPASAPAVASFAGKYLTVVLENEAYGIGVLKVREIIQRLKDEGKTVFFSSHELGEVEAICDHVAIVHQGELKVTGTVAEISAGHANLEQAFLKIVGFQPTPAP